MPLPEPGDNESQDDFISRAMSNNIMQREYPTQDQRLAVAYSQWRRKSKKSENMSEKSEVKDKSKVFIAPKSNAGPNYPDKGTDHIWQNQDIQNVNLFECPGGSDVFKKACAEMEKTMKDALKKC